MVTNLQTLEDRIMERLDCEQAESVIEEEFARFESEVQPMSDHPDKIGQARLTDREVKVLPMGNQHTKWNTIRWQCVKGAAIYYGVVDWTKRVDPTLTYEENIGLMREAGTQNNDESMREIKAKVHR